jgi:hypothetical protein
MAFTSDDLASIDSAIAGGELVIRTADGRMVQYRTIDELKAARALISGQLAGTVSGQRPSRQFRINVDKGVF